MHTFQGIPASPGIAIGPAFKLQETELSIKHTTVSNVEMEIERFEAAVSEAAVQIGAIKEKAISEASPEEAAIFDAGQVRDVKHFATIFSQKYSLNL